MVQPDAHSVRTQLSRITASAGFSSSPQLERFLSFIVGEHLDGRGHRLNAYSIATQAFGRADSFDPDQDAIVRVQAVKLRERLEAYYASQGRGDPVRIRLPKGGYDVTVEAGSSPSGADPAECSGMQNTIGYPVVGVLFSPLPSSDNRIDGFMAGLVEEIVLALTNYSFITVVSLEADRNEGAFTPFARGTGPCSAADYVVSVTTQMFPEGVRIYARLTQARDQRCIWQCAFDVTFCDDDLITRQQTIARVISNSITDPFGPLHRDRTAALHGAADAHRSAFDCVLQVYGYLSDMNGAALPAAQRAIGRAARLAPESSLVWAMQARLCCEQYRFTPLAGEQRRRILESARCFALKGLKADPGCVHAMMAMSCVMLLQGRLDEGRRLGERALSRAGNDSFLKAEYGFALALGSEWEAGIALIRSVETEHALLADRYLIPLMVNAEYEGDLKTALQIAGNIASEDFFGRALYLARCHGELGNIEEARVEVETLSQIAPHLDIEAARLIYEQNFPNDTEFVERSIRGLVMAGLAA